MKKENPHDRFAKTVMSKIANAKDFFGGVLPEELKNLINLETLKQDPSSYIDEELSEFISDIVFTCTYKQSAIKLVLLFEHKSFVPSYPHFQLLQYNLNLWNRYIHDGKKPPMILPVLLYHGKKKWKKKKLVEYLSVSDVASNNSRIKHKEIIHSFVPEFDYILINLSSYQHEVIEKQLFRKADVKIWLLLQKYIYEKDKLLGHLNSILSADILYFREEAGLRFLRTALLYIAIGSGLTIKEVNKAIKHTDPIIREGYMTLYEQISQEGIKKGTLQNKQDVLIRQLSRKFGLAEEEKSFIKGIDNPSILECGLDEILFADSKDQVIEALKDSE